MSTSEWWEANGRLVRWTVAVAVVCGLVGGSIWGPGAGLLIAGSILGFMAILSVSSAAMVGSEQTLDAQIRMRERNADRRDRERT